MEIIKKKFFFVFFPHTFFSGGQHSFKSEHLLQVILQLPQHGFQLRNLLLQVAWRVTASERGHNISTQATDIWNRQKKKCNYDRRIRKSAAVLQTVSWPCANVSASVFLPSPLYLCYKLLIQFSWISRSVISSFHQWDYLHFFYFFYIIYTETNRMWW